jgi:hypothetical protein
MEDHSTHRCKWRVEARVIHCVRLHGLLHGVVDVENDTLRAICAVPLFVLALDDGEGLQHVVHIVASDAVAVEVGGSSLRWEAVTFNIQERVILNPMYTA